MTKLRRLLRNVPVLLLLAAAPVFGAPGWYNVSSLHTALQVLAMAGG